MHKSPPALTNKAVAAHKLIRSIINASGPTGMGCDSHVISRRGDVNDEPVSRANNYLPNDYRRLSHN